MRASAWLTQFVVAAVVFSVIDVLWLSTVATDLYDEQQQHEVDEHGGRHIR